MSAITIYTKDWCPYCAAAKQLLTEKGAPFTEIDIGAKPEMRAEMISEGRRPHVRAADFYQRAPYRRLRRHLCAGRAGRTRGPVEGLTRAGRCDGTNQQRRLASRPVVIMSGS